MESPELLRLRAAIIRDPGNAELRYLLGAELAQRREYPEAVLQMRTALDINPKLHFARLQLGLLYLTHVAAGRFARRLGAARGTR